MHDYSPSPGVGGKIRMGKIFIHEYICRNICIIIHIPWGEIAPAPGECREKCVTLRGVIYKKQSPGK
jgi:hypothetical protein